VSRPTTGFRTTADLMDHFQKHRHEFSFATAREYEAAAIALFAANTSPTLVECTRSSHDVLRFDMLNDFFGVLSPDAFVRTFYRPRRRRGETKRDYFARQCAL
jgi:pyocin large subunit-like protein